MFRFKTGLLQEEYTPPQCLRKRLALGSQKIRLYYISPRTFSVLKPFSKHSAHTLAQGVIAAAGPPRSTVASELGDTIDTSRVTTTDRPVTLIDFYINNRVIND